MTQKNFFVFLIFASLTTLIASPGFANCEILPKTWDIKSIILTTKDLSATYKVRVEIKDLRDLSCEISSDYKKENTLIRFAKSKISANQSIGTIAYENTATGRITQTEEVDILGIAFNAKTQAIKKVWGTEYELGRYFITDITGDATGMGFDRPQSEADRAVSSPTQIIRMKE